MLKRAPGRLWAGLRHPWVAAYGLFYILGLVLLVAAGQEEALRQVLASGLIGGVGLAAAAWFLRGEESRPGPGLRRWLGVLLALGLTLWQILEPRFLPVEWLPGLLQNLLFALFFLAVVPAAALLATRVPWKLLGMTRSMARRTRRWGWLGWVLVVLLALPAVLRLASLSPLREEPLWRIPLAVVLAYGYTLLAQAVPQEFLYRQVLQPRLQALLRQTTAAIVLQALLFGAALTGPWISLGLPWPLALLTALLQGSAPGLFYGLLRDRTGSLYLPVLLHAWVEMWVMVPLVLQWWPF